MFLGNYTSNITNGKRLAIPKKFRNILGKQFIVAKWYEKCLVVIEEEKWSELMEKLTGGQNTLTGAVRDTDRFIMGSAYEVDVDSQGRFVVPDSLMKFAGITDEVVFLGLGDRIEAWDKKEWEARESYIAENAAALLEKANEK